MKLVEPNWVFFDIGAYFGYYSLLVSKMSKDRGKVYAFEPLSRDYELLNYNKELTGFANVEVMKLAVADRVGEVHIIIPRIGNQGHARIE